MTSKEVLVDFY